VADGITRGTSAGQTVKPDGAGVRQGRDRMATQTQVRCAECNRRLADYVNEVVAGQVILELKCSKCGQPHMEVIRHQSEMDPDRSTTVARRAPRKG
jgi:phage FluMu protein Com